MKHIICVLALVLCTTAVTARESADYEATATGVKRYRTVCLEPDDRAKQGVHHVVGSDQTVFVAIDVLVTPKWKEDDREWVRVDKDDIRLVLGKEERAMIGCANTPHLQDPTSLLLRRRSDWKKEPGEIRHSLYFPVPAGASKGVLRLGTQKLPITFPGELLPQPVFARGESAEIRKAVLLDEIRTTCRLQQKEYPTVRRNPFGKILAVSFVMKPKDPNWGTEYYWMTDWIQLRMPSGQVITTFGEGEPADLSTGYNHTLRRDENGKWKEREVTYYFAVPANLKKFTLCTRLIPFVEGTVKQ